jgi:hypothetical protein
VTSNAKFGKRLRARSAKLVTRIFERGLAGWSPLTTTVRRNAWHQPPSTPSTEGDFAVWIVRYHLSRWLLMASLWVMPRGAYRTELRRRIYDFKNEVLINALLD